MESVNKKISGFPEFLPQQQKTFQKLIAKIQKILIIRAKIEIQQ